jgi:hypothetical protein
MGGSSLHYLAILKQHLDTSQSFTNLGAVSAQGELPFRFRYLVVGLYPVLTYENSCARALE